MKNIFKFMGIALMACSFTMVACSKDDDKNTDTPDIPVDLHAINITYGGDLYAADTVYAEIADNMINASIYTGTDDDPLFTFKSGIENGGRYTLEGTNYYARYYAKASDDEPTAISTQTGTITIAAIDVNAKTISAAVTAEMGEANSGNMLVMAITNAVLSL